MTHAEQPVPGIAAEIDRIRAAGYEVVVVSTRCSTSEGYWAVRDWLFNHNIYVDKVLKEKPPAVVYIDDRAICFNGEPTGLLEQIENFQPWTAKIEEGVTHDEKAN